MPQARHLDAVAVPEHGPLVQADGRQHRGRLEEAGRHVYN